MQHLTSLAALAAIRLYQRFISPHKGYSCAWRVHTGGASCSTLGYRVIRRHGLWRGLPLLRERMRRCGVVHYRCQQQQQHPRPGIAALVAQRGFCDISCDLPGDCGPDPTNCCDLLSGCGDCGGCDWPSRRRREEDRNAHVPRWCRG